MEEEKGGEKPGTSRGISAFKEDLLNWKRNDRGGITRLIAVIKDKHLKGSIAQGGEFNKGKHPQKRELQSSISVLKNRRLFRRKGNVSHREDVLRQSRQRKIGYSADIKTKKDDSHRKKIMRKKEMARRESLHTGNIRFPGIIRGRSRGVVRKYQETDCSRHFMPIATPSRTCTRKGGQQRNMKKKDSH